MVLPKWSCRNGPVEIVLTVSKSSRRNRPGCVEIVLAVLKSRRRPALRGTRGPSPSPPRPAPPAGTCRLRPRGYPATKRGYPAMKRGYPAVKRGYPAVKRGGARPRCAAIDRSKKAERELAPPAQRIVTFSFC
eukprot:1194805-Prorocentrum_minimum.AAC.1